MTGPSGAAVRPRLVTRFGSVHFVACLRAKHLQDAPHRMRADTFVARGTIPVPAPVGHALRRVGCSMCFCDASQGISGNVQRKISAAGRTYIAVVRVAI